MSNPKDTIIVHCSATPPDMYVDASIIKDWHVNGNGWSDNGYNVVILRSGEIQNGRDLDGDGDVYEEIGAHAKGFNTGSIGICLVGGLNSKGKPDANFTMAQYRSLELVIKDIKSIYNIKRVIGHRDVDPNKECPCFDVASFVGE